MMFVCRTCGKPITDISKAGVAIMRPDLFDRSREDANLSSTGLETFLFHKGDCDPSRQYQEKLQGVGGAEREALIRESMEVESWDELIEALRGAAEAGGLPLPPSWGEPQFFGD